MDEILIKGWKDLRRNEFLKYMNAWSKDDIRDGKTIEERILNYCDTYDGGDIKKILFARYQSKFLDFLWQELVIEKAEQS